MGEVYRARDMKLKREVAIKILTPEFSSDSERVSRFQREAEVLASVNHPNIAAIYDLQEANGSRYIVLELVEGETLADRIERGPIPVEEALDIAKSIKPVACCLIPRPDQLTLVRYILNYMEVPQILNGWSDPVLTFAVLRGTSISS